MVRLKAIISVCASCYNLVGKKTASGQVFNPNSNSAAMYRVGIARMGDAVTVRLWVNSESAVGVVVNDTGPFAQGPDKKVLIPLQPDPIHVIDLTPKVFQDLAGSIKAGKVPVDVIIQKSEK